MRQILLFLSVILPIVSFGNSHEPEETEMVKEIRTFYDELDHSDMKTDYLFNRGFVLINSLEEWNSGMPVITSNSLWNHMLKCIDASKIKRQAGVEKLMVPDEKISIVDESVIPITVLNYIGDYIQHERVIEYVKSNVPLIYEPMTIFAGNVLKHKVYSGYVTFSWSPELYYSNNKGKDVRFDIDFSDSQGFIPVDLNQSQQINVDYDCVGEKSICFRLIEGGDTLISYSNIDIKTLETEPILKSTNVDFNVNGLDYLYDEGADGKLDKPIIISEGFDLMNGQSKSDLQSKWSGRMSTLKANGYDIFYVDYDDASQLLENNAAIIANLIQEINNEKEGNYEGVYIGESMGGIIGRIALKNLENSGYDHQIGLYVPYDSPFKGAYIPEGLQWTMADLYEQAGNLTTGIFLVSIFDGLFNANVPSAGFLMSQLNSPAAMQMLVRHYTQLPIHYVFRNYLDNLGYPSLSRNVAIVNGSDDAEYQSAPAIPGAEIFDHNLFLGLLNYSVEANYTKAAEDRVAIVSVYELFPLPHWSYSNHSIGAGSMLFTNAPGSYMEREYDVLGYSGHVKFTFVPTLSAIDISNSIYNSGNFVYFDNNEDAIIANGLTPFDDIYINSINEGHTFRESFFYYSQFPKHEIMYSDMYLQNRALNYDRDFEASNSITVGSNTQPWGNDKHQDTGDFIINSGATVNMEAGTSIKLESGFKLCNGANFKASVDGSNPMLKSSTVEQIEPPIIVGNKYAITNDRYAVAATQSRNRTIEWTLIGNEYKYQVVSDELFIPEDIPKGQYTLFAKYRNNGQEESSSRVIILKNAFHDDLSLDQSWNNNIIVAYPNPANEKVTIKIEKESLSELELFIKSITGETIIYRVIPTRDKMLDIDISKLAKGVYFIILTEDTNVVTTQKFLKQ